MISFKKNKWMYLGGIVTIMCALGWFANVFIPNKKAETIRLKAPSLEEMENKARLARDKPEEALGDRNTVVKPRDPKEVPPAIRFEQGSETPRSAGKILLPKSYDPVIPKVDAIKAPTSEQIKNLTQKHPELGTITPVDGEGWITLKDGTKVKPTMTGKPRLIEPVPARIPEAPSEMKEKVEQGQKMRSGA